MLPGLATTERKENRTTEKVKPALPDLTLPGKRQQLLFLQELIR